MKSPEQFALRKCTLQKIINCNYKLPSVNIEKLQPEPEDESIKLDDFKIDQQYNQLFRILNQQGRIKNKVIYDVIFVNCKNHKNYHNELLYILENGFYIGYKHYSFYGKSASMGRSGILAFLSDEIYNIVNEKAMMGLKLNKVVLSKFEAYKHLLFSSCFCIEKKLPYMIVVDDYEKTIQNVNIKYVVEKEYTTNNGDTRTYKAIEEGHKDININTNDGAGFCSFEMAKEWADYLELDYTPCVFMLRVPYIKGLVVSFDFKKFYKEKGIKYIKDLWGHRHNIDNIDIILTKSQYKGIKYFKFDNTYNDWLEYINRLKKYGHCLGISKWNFSHSEEPKKTRANYQILQTLNLKGEDLINLSQYTREWIEKILNGDLIYIYNYLGLNKNQKPSNNYMRALLLNPKMLNDIKIRNYLYGLLRNTVDELKIGKMYLNGAFKILIPDIIMMAEYIGGLNPVGVLKEGEMYAKDHIGEYVLNRNPHICASEHVILNAVNNGYIQRWCSHLENVCMVNGYDVTAPRLNGADFDGDLCFVHNDKLFIEGVRRNLPIVLDIEDKITAIEKDYTSTNLNKFTIMSLDSRIGEISNDASGYHNKCTNNPKSKKRNEDNTCLLSVINGKEIDYAKTGLRWNVPRNVAKFAKPLPYFLKYKYKNLKTVSKAYSPMNTHCWYIEKWQRKLKRNLINDFINTSDCIIDKNIPIDAEKYTKVEAIFKEFKKELKNIQYQEKRAKMFKESKYDIDGLWDGLKTEEVIYTKVDMNIVYDKYKQRLSEIVPNQSELANYIIDLVYNKGKGRYYIFAWKIAEEGILTNLRANQTKPLMIPVETTKGVEYLGKYYILEPYYDAV